LKNTKKDRLKQAHEKLGIKSKRLSVEDANYDYWLDRGYYPIEMLIDYKHDNRKHQLVPKLKIEKATKKDAKEIGRIAQIAFIHSRLHRDPNVNQELVADFFRIWGEELINRDTEVLICRTRAGKIMGFLGALPNRVDLVAVDHKYLGRKVGSSLLKQFMINNEGKEVYAGTQACNILARILYERNGFYRDNNKITLHKKV